MRRSNTTGSLILYALTLLPLCASQIVVAQTTQFTYQGKLADTGSPASGQYDFQFKLFDTATVGTGVQQGGIVAVSNVTVTAGIFTVQIDFGAGVFPAAANRFLEIALKPNSGSTFTTLSPRQPVTANPYAIRSLNATSADGLSVSCVNCVTSSQIQSVQGSQLTGSIAGSQISGLIPVASVPSGSANYIQNTTSLQATSNFNISGSGTAAGTLSGNIVNAATQYNIGGDRILSGSVVSFNLTAGINAGSANTGTNNSFVGPFAGTHNTTGTYNSFFGSFAGNSNTTGQQNSFFGQGTGTSSTTASDNSFFGFNAGFSTTSAGNSFFGSNAGSANTTGDGNSFFGTHAGQSNSTGTNNSFFGRGAGFNNTDGFSNAFFGYQAGNQNTSGKSNTFVGVGAGEDNTVGGNNSFVGLNAGQSNSSGCCNVFVGDQAGILNSTGQENTFVGGNTGFNNTTGVNNTLIGNSASVGFGNLFYATAIGSQATVSTSNTIVLGRDFGPDTVDVPGKLQIDTLATAGSTNLCLNGSNRVGMCSSSLRYKTNLKPFATGLSIINRLHPITFTWKQDGKRDLGLGAEDVAKVEPLLTFTNSKGEIEGVKYNQLGAVFINAFKEQQKQIEEQQIRIKERERQAAIQEQQIEQYRKQLTRQQEELGALKRIVCLGHSKAEVCRARRHSK